MQNPIARIQMENGKTIKIELDPKSAPNTVNSFIFLAEKGCFNSHAMERIVPGYVADMSYTAFGKEECKYLIENESRSHGFSNDIKIEPGVIGMGGYGEAGIAGGEFFFPLAYHEKLQGNYPAFGRVLEGLDEIMRWEKVELVSVPYPEEPSVEINRPKEPIIIKSVEIETFGIHYPAPIKKNMEKRPPSW